MDGDLLRNRVRELRERLNLRQIDVAREVCVTRQTILAIEKGRLNPSVALAMKIARVLREPTDYVFYLQRPPVHPAVVQSMSGKEEELHGEPPAFFDFS